MPTMKTLVPLGVAVLVVILTGCANSRARQEVCRGFVTKIEEHPGDHYSPAKGHKPLTSVFVDLIPAEHRSKSATVTLRILVLGQLPLSLCGHEGDTVQFLCPRHSLQTRTVWYDELNAYKVVSRRAGAIEDFVR